MLRHDVETNWAAFGRRCPLQPNASACASASCTTIAKSANTRVWSWVAASAAGADAAGAEADTAAAADSTFKRTPLRKSQPSARLKNMFVYTLNTWAMPPAILFLTVFDRTVSPVNQASSFARLAGPKSKKEQYKVQIFFSLYAISSRPGAMPFQHGAEERHELKALLAADA